MQVAKISPSGRFIVLDGLHLDRMVFEALATWASEKGLRLQDAIQLAICAFNDGAHMKDKALPATGAMVRRSSKCPQRGAAER